MMAKSGIGEELNDEEFESNLVNDVIPKLEEFGESSRVNKKFMKLRYVPLGRTSNFSFGCIPKKTTFFEKNSLIPISQIG